MARAGVTSRGFTLLELIITLFVLALAASLSAPMIGRNADAIRVRAQIAGFSALFRHAREQAITSGSERSVVIDPPGRQITIVADDDQVKRTRAIPAGWTIEANPPPKLTVRFDPQGSSSGGDFRIVAGSITYHVTVDALTGRVRSASE